MDASLPQFDSVEDDKEFLSMTISPVALGLGDLDEVICSSGDGDPVTESPESLLTQIDPTDEATDPDRLRCRSRLLLLEWVGESKSECGLVNPISACNLEEAATESADLPSLVPFAPIKLSIENDLALT